MRGIAFCPVPTIGGLSYVLVVWRCTDNTEMRVEHFVKDVSYERQ